MGENRKKVMVSLVLKNIIYEKTNEKLQLRYDLTLNIPANIENKKIKKKGVKLKKEVEKQLNLFSKDFLKTLNMNFKKYDKDMIVDLLREDFEKEEYKDKTLISLEIFEEREQRTPFGGILFTDYTSQYEIDQLIANKKVEETLLDISNTISNQLMKIKKTP